MVQAQFIQHGDSVDYTPAADVAAGEVVVVGSLVGVAKRDIKANVMGAITVVGVFDIDKDSAEVIALGDSIYWDDTNSRATTVTTDNTYMGKAVLAAGAGTTTVRVRVST